MTCNRTLEIARFSKVLRRSKQHGRMAIVTACVHLAECLGSPRLATGFGYRKGIHVGAKADDRPVAMPSTNKSDHSGLSNAGLDRVAAEFLQLLRSESRCFVHVVKNLRILVQVPAPFGDVLLHFMSTVDQRHFRFPSAWCIIGTLKLLLG